MTRLSVVVPVYNVERYLDECLSSVAGQTLDDLEVVVVDDGSPDDSAAIARSWCDRDRRFRLVQQENHGLGHARNTGTTVACGTYLAFLDSDDVVPRDAYQRMVETLEQTGSDVCSGGVRRLLDSGVTRPSPMHSRSHARPSLGVRLEEQPELLRDRLAVNKVWRRRFWLEHGVRFPEAMLYEDTPTIIPALAEAGGIDVITETVYLWRLRSRGPASITQDRRDVKHVRDRARGVQHVSQALGDADLKGLKRAYDRSVLEGDLEIFLNQFDLVGPAYREETFELVRRYLAGVSPGVLDELRAVTRVKYLLAERDDHESMVRLAEFLRDRGLRRTNHRRRRRRVVLDLPLEGLSASDLPLKVVDDTRNLPLASRVLDVRWEADYLIIDGWAYIRGVPMATRRAARIAVWATANNGRKVRASVAQRLDHEVTRTEGHLAANYDWARFEARFPLDAFRRVARQGAKRLDVHVRVRSRGVSREERLHRPDRGRVRTPPTLELDPQRLLRPTWQDAGLALVVLRSPPELRSAHVEDEHLVMRVKDTRATNDSVLRLATKRGTSVVGAQKVDGDIVEFRVTLSKLGVEAAGEGSEARARFELRYCRSRSAKRRPLRLARELDGPLLSADGREIALRRTRHGNASVLVQPALPRLNEAKWLDEATLRLELEFDEKLDLTGCIARASSDQQALTARTTVRGVTSARVDLVLGGTVRQPAGERLATLPARKGRWVIAGLVAGRERPIEVPADITETLPIEIEHRNRTYRAEAHRRRLAVVISSQLPPEERGPYRQHRLQTVDYPAMRRQSLTREVVYDCHGGRQFADSPRVLFDQLVAQRAMLDHCVTVDDQQSLVPDGANELSLGSRAHYRAMARACLVVFNSFQPVWFEPRDGQLVVQTWHGTALKRIGKDSLRSVAGGARETQRLSRLASTWSWMVSPSPHMTAVYRSAWGFAGRILETGYPRNDPLVAADAEDRARKLRDEFGIEKDRRVILYAPTFRDSYLADGGGRTGPLLDLALLAAELDGDDLLLVRAHHLAGFDVPSDPRLAVRDVSHHIDVQDLLLVADVLITDYSSVMFDFANTSRPMIFHAPDLAEYRDHVRGFYFDLEEIAPGPVTIATGDVVEALRIIDQTHAENQERYTAFRERFCPWDDGNAGKRLAEAVIAEMDVG